MGQAVSVDPEDPPGVHLLLLLAGPLSPAEAVPLLEQQLAEVGKPPALPRHWSVPLRGPVQKQGAPLELPASYLERIAEQLPQGWSAVHALFVPAVR